MPKKRPKFASDGRSVSAKIRVGRKKGEECPGSVVPAPTANLIVDPRLLQTLPRSECLPYLNEMESVKASLIWPDTGFAVPSSFHIDELSTTSVPMFLRENRI